MRDGIKLLGRGANNFTHKIDIEVSYFLAVYAFHHFTLISHTF